MATTLAYPSNTYYTRQRAATLRACVRRARTHGVCCQRQRRPKLCLLRYRAPQGLCLFWAPLPCHLWALRPPSGGGPPWLDRPRPSHVRSLDPPVGRGPLWHRRSITPKRGGAASNFEATGGFGPPPSKDVRRGGLARAPYGPLSEPSAISSGMDPAKTHDMVRAPTCHAGLLTVPTGSVFGTPPS